MVPALSTFIFIRALPFPKREKKAHWGLFSNKYEKMHPGELAARVHSGNWITHERSVTGVQERTSRSRKTKARTGSNSGFGPFFLNLPANGQQDSTAALISAKSTCTPGSSLTHAYTMSPSLLITNAERLDTPFRPMRSS